MRLRAETKAAHRVHRHHHRSQQNERHQDAFGATPGFRLPEIFSASRALRLQILSLAPVH